MLIRKFFDGFEYYNDKGQLHREDGPARDWNSYKSWHKNGKRHRLDGPAREWKNGSYEWWVDDRLHRIDGPACKYTDGSKEWYYQGERIKCNSQEEFIRIMKLKVLW